MDADDMRSRLRTNTKLLMSLADMSRTDLARAIGRDPAVITNLLAGRREWSIGDIYAIGVALRLRDPLILTRPSDEVVREADGEPSRDRGKIGATIDTYSPVANPFSLVTHRMGHYRPRLRLSTPNGRISVTLRACAPLAAPRRSTKGVDHAIFRYAA